MMTFRRLLGAFGTLACIAAGLLRAFILLEGTDASGFVRTGPLWGHYLLLAAPVLLLLLLSLAVPTGTCHRFAPAAGIPAFCGMLFSGTAGICLFALGQTGTPVLAAAVLMALGCLWFAGQMLRGSDAGPFFGVLGTLGWLVVCVLLFSGKAASLHHIPHVLELLCSAGILLFLCGVLRAAYAADAPGISRMLFFRGMLAFYVGVCLLLPQELWLWKQNQTVLFFQGKCAGAALLGISGLIWALRCMCGAGEPCREEPEADPAAVFAEAERRLLEDKALSADGAEAPQRWSSAASALYGGAVPKAEPTAPKNEPAAPNAEPTLLKAEPVLPKTEPAVSEPEAPAPQVVPASRTVPTASESAVSPAPEAQKSAATVPAAETAATPAQKPAAAPAHSGSAMARLDALLENIDPAPKSDSIDALLADLDRMSAKNTAAENTAGEKWVFRRD